MVKFTRRQVLYGGLAAAAVWPSLGAVRAAQFDSDPFTLGVASGCPRPNSIVLWTRLVFGDPNAPLLNSNPFAPVPAAAEHGPVDVEWVLADDENFSKIVQSGVATATPDFAHSVHIEVKDLAPDRWYFYRFRSGDYESPTGRTRTAPAADADISPFTFAFASCQQYEQGFYAPYRDMADRDLDLVVHLGDYIYEMSWGSNFVRQHGTGAPSLLFEYRDRYALYKSDENLKAAHAAFPWIVTWDDHEVFHNYLLKSDLGDLNREAFIKRRAAAYQAWYEHMPVPPTMARDFSNFRIYDSYRFGNLLDLAVLDIRQYRTEPDAGDTPPFKADIFGAEQEAWLDKTLKESTARWTIVAQQTLLSERDLARGPDTHYSHDGWDGYRASRQRLVKGLGDANIANPLVIGGDLHAFYAADVKADYSSADAPTVAAEFVSGSITSDGPTEDSIATVLAENPHLKYANGKDHGYGIMTLDAGKAKTDFMIVADRKKPDAKTSMGPSFVVADGQKGAVRV
jgi:alkaline phosphatase D